MKRLQNEISRISTNLIRNLKIKIILISVLNWYFFENNQLCIESYLIDIESISNHILSVSCIDFSISPILANNHFQKRQKLNLLIFIKVSEQVM